MQNSWNTSHNTSVCRWKNGKYCICDSMRFYLNTMMTLLDHSLLEQDSVMDRAAAHYGESPNELQPTQTDGMVKSLSY